MKKNKLFLFAVLLLQFHLSYSQFKLEPGYVSGACVAMKLTASSKQLSFNKIPLVYPAGTPWNNGDILNGSVTVYWNTPPGDVKICNSANGSSNCDEYHTTTCSPIPSDDISTAPLVCDLTAGYGGTSSGLYDYNNNATQDPIRRTSGQWSGTLENTSWLRFIVGANTVDFDINVYGCSSGIQFGVVEDLGGGNYRVITDRSWTSTTGFTGANTITSTGMTIGREYYIVVDGDGGAVCDYDLNFNSGLLITTVSASNSTICANDPTTLSIDPADPSATYTWTDDQGNVLLDEDGNPYPNSSSITVSPDVSTNYQVVIEGGQCYSSNTLNTSVTVDYGPSCCIYPNYVTNLPAAQCGGSVNLSGVVTSSDGIVSYHPTYSDADNNTNALSGSSLTVSSSGTYYARIVKTGESQYCEEIVTIPVVISSPGSVITPSISGCLLSGEDLTVSPNGSSYTYSWSPNGENTSTITTNSGGTYSVTVDNGCTSASTSVVVEGYTMNLPPALCNDYDLTTSVNITNGTPSITYHTTRARAEAGTNVLTGSQLSVSSSGNYWARIQSSSDPSCYRVEQIPVTINFRNINTVTLNASSLSICEGQSVDLNAVIDGSVDVTCTASNSSLEDSDTRFKERFYFSCPTSIEPGATLVEMCFDEIVFEQGRTRFDLDLAECGYYNRNSNSASNRSELINGNNLTGAGSNNITNLCIDGSESFVNNWSEWQNCTPTGTSFNLDFVIEAYSSAGFSDDHGVIGSVTFTYSNAIDPNTLTQLWTGPGTINNANTPNATVTGLTEGTYVFNYQVTDPTGCIITKSISITVNAALPTYSSNLPSPQCDGSIDVSNVITITGGTGSVSYHNTLSNAQNNTGILTGAQLTTNTSKSFWARVQNADGSCYETIEIPVNITSSITPSFSYETGCVNGVATVISVSPASGTFSVVALDGDSPSINSSSGELSNITQGNRYDVTYTISNGACGSQSSTVTYTADICNNCSLTPSTGGAICLGDQVSISSSGNCDVPDVVNITNNFNSGNNGWSTSGNHTLSNSTCTSNELWFNANSSGVRHAKSSSYNLDLGNVCNVSFDFFYGNGTCSGPNASNETIELFYSTTGSGNPSSNPGAWTSLGVINSSGIQVISLPAGAISANTYFDFYQQNGGNNSDNWGFDDFVIDCDFSPTNTITWTSSDGSYSGTTTSGQSVNVTPSALPVTYTATISDGLGGSSSRNITFTEDPSCSSCDADAGSWSSTP